MAVGDQQRRVVDPPGGLVGAKEFLESRSRPAGGRGLGDRGKGRHGAVAPRVLERQCDCAMTTHGVAEDALARHVEGEVPGDQLRKLVADITLHAVVTGIGLLRRIEIEARARAELPAVRLIGHVRATRAGVRTDDGDAVGGGRGPVFALVHDVLVGAGQARKIPQHRHRPVLRLMREVDRKSHRASAGLALMAIDALRAAEGFRGGKEFHAAGPSTVWHDACHSGAARAEPGTCDRASPFPIGLCKRRTRSRVPGSARCAAPE